ncbi:hypothetical protein LWI29_032276 [Acer saccharum]|uniref:Reverse transcriptase Ty1/copia-type domain-containing protein n=1 Tax=Acer saccharum TaxID=4024 RepID=A0AA39RFR0_ACESA|nr:hypothetical protein LWI29_032276 [Acer saccharum]
MTSSSHSPHPAGVGVSITVVKLNDTNYLLWSKAVKKYLTTQGKEQYLTTPQLVDDAKDLQKWLREHTMVTTWLWNSMEPVIASTTMWIETTKELWDYLQERFNQSKNASRIYDVYSSFFSSQQGDKSLSELNSYHPITTNKNLLKKLREELMVVRFLSSLNLMYESAKNSILTEKELPTIKEVYARLKTLSLNPSNTQESSALLSSREHGRGQPSKHGRGRGRGRGGQYCSHCGWNNYNSDKCNLSPRSVKCIFLGYSKTQKGYKCLNPIFGKTYVSADVKFVESTSYFSDQGSSLESNLLSPYPHIPSPVIPTTQPYKPLQVYQRWKNLPLSEVDRQGNSTPSNQAPIQESTSNHDLSTCNEKSDLDIPIAIRKGQRSTVRCQSDHYVFVRHTSSGVVILVVYVDDIIISVSDVCGVEEVKTQLKKQFQTKDWGQLRYFLGIEVARGKNGLVLSQRKYTQGLFSEIHMLGSKPAKTPMDPNIHLDDEGSPEFEDKRRYRRLVDKLIYLTVTRPDITFAMGAISQYMQNPKKVH